MARARKGLRAFLKGGSWFKMVLLFALGGYITTQLFPASQRTSEATSVQVLTSASSESQPHMAAHPALGIVRRVALRVMPPPTGVRTSVGIIRIEIHLEVCLHGFVRVRVRAACVCERVFPYNFPYW
jgi:hypothetical protein